MIEIVGVLSVKSVMLVLLLSASLLSCTVSGERNGRNRASAGLAPDPIFHSGAVVQVYAADAWGWRGWFAVQTWIAAKRSIDDAYTVYDVVGWRQRWGRPVVAAYQDVPDRHWFGAKPQLIADLRGEQASTVIDEIEQAVNDYPWKNEYRVFPGPTNRRTKYQAPKVSYRPSALVLLYYTFLPLSVDNRIPFPACL